MLVLLNMSKRNVVIVLGVWLWHCFKTTVYVCVVLNIATFWGDTIVPRDQLNMTKLLSLEKDVVMAKKLEMGGQIIFQYFYVGSQNICFEREKLQSFL